jgi:hypothetical protein
MNLFFLVAILLWKSGLYFYSLVDRIPAVEGISLWTLRWFSWFTILENLLVNISSIEILRYQEN